MTTTSKSSRFRTVAVSSGGTLAKAAKVFGTGSAGLGLQVAQRGYTLARRSAERRSAQRSLAALTGPKPKSASTSTKTRKFVVLGSIVGVAVAAAVLVTRRRNTFVPPADAPPSLDDYADTPPGPDGARLPRHSVQ
ncbi:hypothetical protein [Rhodococcus sp. P1Y]|uniref:hypothetical protein n=1 Tax=Rhodococcus sp. P1Y TaxID=1302308 RepID=UPI000EB15668|nr:hypothetical protein [Rhodococcus sp. P1Y]AYJ47563.1 hypothetical protein D8W71_03520 [Rhodococcus sp. P1Y]